MQQNHPTRHATTTGIVVLVLLSLAGLSVAGMAGCSSHRPSGATSTAERIANMEQATQLASQAQVAMANKDWDKAISLSQQSVVQNPNFGAAWNNLGLAFMGRAKGTDYLAAQQAFQQAVSLLPGDPTPSRNLGVLYEQRGFAEDALRYYNQALSIDENDRDALRGSAKAGFLTHATDPLHLDRLRRAQLIETDKQWLEFIKRERIRVENEIAERN
jgi:tetratricopeptide (TPR) repeat protein